MAKEYPYIGMLEEREECPFSEEDTQRLKRIGGGEEDITSVKVGNTWNDDHEMCVNLTVNGVEFSALWISPEFYADIIYAGKGNEDAMECLIDYIDHHADKVK